MAKETKYNRRYIKWRQWNELDRKKITYPDNFMGPIADEFEGHFNISYDLFDLGIEWFNAGRTLEEIDNLNTQDELYVKLQDKYYKHSFEVGFNFAKRKKMIFDIDMKRGIDFYNNGGDIDLLDEERLTKLSDGFISGYESAKNSLHDKELERAVNKDKPSYEDRQNESEQKRLGKELFDSGKVISDEELRDMGYYVKNQYLFEKRRYESSLIAYNAGKNFFLNGKNLEELTGIYKDNADFLRGYRDALNEDYSNKKGNTR